MTLAIANIGEIFDDGQYVTLVTETETSIILPEGPHAIIVRMEERGGVQRYNAQVELYSEPESEKDLG